MRVIVDATAIPVHLGGVGRYVVELVPSLASLGADVVVVSRPGAGAWVGEAGRSLDLVEASGITATRPGRMAWEQSGLPRLISAVGAQVVLSPHYSMPAVSSAARVVTLHDATFFSAPEVHGRFKRVYFRAAIKRAVRGADALVVPSAATRQEVLRYAGGDPARFHVAFHGVDSAVFHPVNSSERTRVAQSLGLGRKPYVAFLGTLEPRKNVPALIRGWQSAVRQMPDPPALVLAGGQGWDHQVDAAVAAVPPHLTVLRPGYLPVGDLAAYLAGAHVVAYPSLGEGFGLPILEAMASGAAVLTSRELSLPEVGGDAVAYTGTSAEEIANQLAGLLADPQRRAALADAGVQRAAAFTWERSARAHLEAFEAAMVRRTTRGR